MKNILLVNELGAGSNHLDKLLYASNLLKGEKCKFYFAMPRIELQTEKIFSQDHKFFVTPMLDPYRKLDNLKNETSLGDILWNRGFDELQLLELLLKIWDFEFKLRKIDLVIANWAPGVIQAARNKIPTINISTYWDLPHYRHKLTPTFNNLERMADESIMIENINKISSGNKKIKTVSEALHADVNFLLNEPEFDLSSRRDFEKRALGSINARALIKYFFNDDKDRKKIFVYLHYYHDITKKILQEIYKLNIAADIYIPEIIDSEKNKLADRKINFTERKTLEEINKKYYLCIHHAGGGFTEDMAILGIPQIVLPIYPQNRVNSTAIKRLGFGEMISLKPNKHSSDSNLKDLIEKWGSKTSVDKVLRNTNSLRKRQRPNIDNIILSSIKKFLRA